MKINNTFRHEHCPLCHSQRILPLGKLNYSGTVKFCTSNIELSDAPELWKCQQCLSRFVQYAVDAETAKTLYSTGQAEERWATVAFEQSKTPDVVNSMVAIFKNRGKVLDVGCNTGELLDFARGFGCETAGVEFSSASREILIQKAHKAYAALAESAEKYDVITAFDLVEHLYDVPNFLQQCRERLTETGRLVILTGNMNSLSARLSKTCWWYAQYPEHIVFPTKKYFSDYSGFCIEIWQATYASKGYKYPFYFGYLRCLEGVLRGRPYTGLPSIGSDHVLMVLKAT